MKKEKCLNKKMIKKFDFEYLVCVAPLQLPCICDSDFKDVKTNA